MRRVSPPHLQDTLFYPMVSGREGGTGLGYLSPAILSINTPAKLNLPVTGAYRVFGLPADSK